MHVLRGQRISLTGTTATANTKMVDLCMTDQYLVQLQNV